MRKIYVIGGFGVGYTNWMQGTIVKSMEECDLVVGTGGADWHPKWYYMGNSPHPSLYTDLSRDIFEYSEFKQAVKLNKKIIGICRSAQGLCCFAGGEIIQDQPNDNFIHRMKTYDGREIEVSSTHHNSAFPFRRLKDGEDYKLLGWTEKTLRYRYIDANEQADINLPEAEDVFYPKINALGIQGHPEMIINSHPETIEYYQDLLDNFMLGKL